jgi:hypothetical protein
MIDLEMTDTGREQHLCLHFIDVDGDVDHVGIDNYRAAKNVRSNKSDCLDKALSLNMQCGHRNCRSIQENIQERGRIKQELTTENHCDSK